MMSKSSFNFLLEKLNKKISEENLKVQQSEQKLLAIENSINNFKQLQLKALINLKEIELKSESTCTELEHIQKLYNKLIENIPNNENEHEKHIYELAKEKNNLQNSLIQAKAEKEKITMKVNNITLKINIQKKKNAATLLYLQKRFEALLQEGKDLLVKLEKTPNQ